MYNGNQNKIRDFLNKFKTKKKEKVQFCPKTHSQICKEVRNIELWWCYLPWEHMKCRLIESRDVTERGIFDFFILPLLVAFFLWIKGMAWKSKSPKLAPISILSSASPYIIGRSNSKPCFSLPLSSISSFSLGTSFCSCIAFFWLEKWEAAREEQNEPHEKHHSRFHYYCVGFCSSLQS